MRKSLNADFLSPKELAAIGIANAASRNILIHRTCVILDFDRLTFGRNVRIDPYCVITSKSLRLGDYVHIGSGCSLTGGGDITMGDFSTLSGNVLVFTSSDDYSGEFMTNPMVPEDYTGVTHDNVHIGRHTVIGARTTILPGAHVEDGVATGVNTLVKEPLAGWHIYAGTPARAIRARKKDCLALEAQLRAAENSGE